MILLSSNFASLAESNQHGKVIISGKVINMTDKSEKVITAINCNPWTDKTSRHAVKIDSLGQFNTFVEIPFGHNFTIYYDRTFFCQYADPGDSLHITIDAANLKSGAHYSGAHEKLNNEYGKAYADIFSESFVDLPSEEMPKEEYLEHFKNTYTELEQTLNRYADSVGLGEDSKDLMRRSLLFGVANSALDHKDKTPERILAFFEDSIFGLDDEENLKEMMFPIHLHAYLNRLERALKPASIDQLIDTIVNRHPKSLNRDVMLAISLKESDECDGYPAINRELFADANIYGALYGRNHDKTSLPDGQLLDGQIFELKNGEILKCDYSGLTALLKNEFKGKIIYLDLWATWCGPCIQANKSLQGVAEFFNGKDVVFVSVAMKSDIDKWKKLASNNTENCRDFFVKSDADAELIMSTFGMDGFPSYRIIGKDSDIISSDPPRPNNPILFDLLSGLLSRP
ncbi:MAG: TlpA family protein disulfide reductase [Muribaculum sp.]|nr:TlpA family protein disulfide reductase [Muribaculum sp.]